MSDDTLATGAASAENPVPGAAEAATTTAAAVTVEPAKATPAAAPAPAAATPAAAAPDAGKDTPDEEGTFGKDWRDKLAKGDEKKLAMLKRFTSPEALLQAQEEAQRKISEGLKPKGKPGDKATDDDWKAYRKEHSIPDAVDDFVKAIVLPDKRVIGDDDKPMVAAFAERAIKKGIAPSDMAEMVDEYYAIQEEGQFQQATADATFKKTAEADLKKEWGGDYAGNFAAMRPYFEGVNPDLFDKLMGGRLADGTKIGNHPDVLRFFAAKAVAENPMATIIPVGGSSSEGLLAEIAGMEKRMRDDRNAWHKDAKAQERYRQLITARDKLKA
ncbi:phosphate starvation-inducible protein PsiF [Mesorhizobium sp. LNJC405B00]|uniref:phosphate starvation-inducible protein PsiF n=1 Tax=Mesorhizobium sp. LNJC405B00 TaxID=1287281 RepID=UPI0003CF96A4|nr:phosphate starvation-inducible protein PsiF [Mesorhizobium sp. LNJC405B00]ESY02286.1 phosphate starvation-inducible protein PsiF [Mesorhizobium sp. LNJC405B00]